MMNSVSYLDRSLYRKRTCVHRYSERRSVMYLNRPSQGREGGCPVREDRTFWVLEQKRNVMAHAQKPDLVFQRNGRVHLYRRGCQFSRLLAAEVCASAVVMLDRPCSDTVHDCWLPPPFAFFPFTSPPVRFRVPSHYVSALPVFWLDSM